MNGQRIAMALGFAIAIERTSSVRAVISDAGEASAHAVSRLGSTTAYANIRRDGNKSKRGKELRCCLSADRLMLDKLASWSPKNPGAYGEFEPAIRLKKSTKCSDSLIAEYTYPIPLFCCEGREINKAAKVQLPYLNRRYCMDFVQLQFNVIDFSTNLGKLTHLYYDKDVLKSFVHMPDKLVLTNLFQQADKDFNDAVKKHNKRVNAENKAFAGLVNNVRRNGRFARGV